MLGAALPHKKQQIRAQPKTTPILLIRFSVLFMFSSRPERFTLKPENGAPVFPFLAARQAAGLRFLCDKPGRRPPACMSVHLPGNANLANSYFAELYKEEQSVSYRIFEDCLLFALIRADDGLSLLLGPACVTDFTESIVRKIARFIGAGPSGQDAVREYLAYAPVLPFNFIAQIIGFLYLVLNREFYSPMDFFSTVPAADEGRGAGLRRQRDPPART